jgi:hypothetical protein
MKMATTPELPVTAFQAAIVPEAVDVLLSIMQHRADENARMQEYQDRWDKEKDERIAELEAEVRRMRPFEEAVRALHYAFDPLDGDA